MLLESGWHQTDSNVGAFEGTQARVGGDAPMSRVVAPIGLEGTVGADVSKGEDVLMGQLREILLGGERLRLQELEEIIGEREKLMEKVGPLIEEHLETFGKRFPKEYGKVVNRMIEQKLKSSQGEILEIIYPLMGKMISKYVSFQFEQLKESIDERIAAMFSKRGLWWRFRNKILGIKDSSALLADLDKPILEEIFIIERDSGLIMGNAALNPKVNREAAAGMLTAIKSFGEDAFDHGKEELDMVQYGTYRILLQTFPFFYFALALRGSVTAAERAHWRETIMDFVLKVKALQNPISEHPDESSISLSLESEFIIPQRKLLEKA